MTTCNITHDAVRDNVMFSIEIMTTLKAIKSYLKQSYDKQNLTLEVISYEMTTRVRSSMYVGGNSDEYHNICFPEEIWRIIPKLSSNAQIICFTG